MILKRANIKAYKRKENRLSCPISYEKLTDEIAVTDHDHLEGHVRKTLDRNSNQLLGKTERNYQRFLGYKKGIDPLPVILRRMAAYLEEDYSGNPLHHSWVDIEVRKFGRMNKDAQQQILRCYDIIPGKTSKIRTKQIKQYYFRKENLWKPD